MTCNYYSVLIGRRRISKPKFPIHRRLFPKLWGLSDLRPARLIPGFYHIQCLHQLTKQAPSPIADGECPICKAELLVRKRSSGWNETFKGEGRGNM
ncbi:hypothetical protein AVEN_267711-1 [Araneus ventricosus]|uniref:Uncharacterized protein n=1 Tax=Araneus ventricosus TaxID=182803 RepID=A0A4Y2CXJ4_ARAVE|nr:hypothetical protein AVEN_267711-1 [Araneus ventricosus]